MPTANRFEANFQKLLAANPNRSERLLEATQSLAARYPTGRKPCTECQAEHGIHRFRIKNLDRGLLKASCIEASLARSKAWYEGNRQSCIDRAKAAKAVQREAGKSFLQDLLKGCACATCGATALHSSLHPYLPSSTRQQTAWMAIGAGLSQGAIERAFRRSTVLCATCLGAMGGRELNAYWADALKHEKENPGRPVVSLNHKGVYRAYRRVAEARAVLPLASSQMGHLQRMATMLRRKQDFIARGELAAALKAVECAAQQSNSNKRARRLRKLGAALS